MQFNKIMKTMIVIALIGSSCMVLSVIAAPAPVLTTSAAKKQAAAPVAPATAQKSTAAVKVVTKPAPKPAPKPVQKPVPAPLPITKKQPAVKKAAEAVKLAKKAERPHVKLDQIMPVQRGKLPKQMM